LFSALSLASDGRGSSGMRELHGVDDGGGPCDDTEATGPDSNGRETKANTATITRARANTKVLSFLFTFMSCLALCNIAFSGRVSYGRS